MQANSPPNEKTAGVASYGHGFENKCEEFVKNYSLTLTCVQKQGEFLWIA